MGSTKCSLGSAHSAHQSESLRPGWNPESETRRCSGGFAEDDGLIRVSRAKFAVMDPEHSCRWIRPCAFWDRAADIRVGRRS